MTILIIKFKKVQRFFAQKFHLPPDEEMVLPLIRLELSLAMKATVCAVASILPSRGAAGVYVLFSF